LKVSARLWFRPSATSILSPCRKTALNHYTDRPWADLRKGKAIDELWLAKQLRPYGVRPCTIRIGTQVAKGYVLDHLKDAFKRYIPRSEIDALKRELAEQTAPDSNGSAAQPAPNGASQNGSGHPPFAPIQITIQNSKIPMVPIRPLLPIPPDLELVSRTADHGLWTMDAAL
jgi:hypothetical protein